MLDTHPGQSNKISPSLRYSTAPFTATSTAPALRNSNSAVGVHPFNATSTPILNFFRSPEVTRGPRPGLDSQID